MPRKSKGLFEAIDDLVVRKRTGGTKQGITPPKPMPLPKIQPNKPRGKGLQAKVNKIRTPRKSRRAKI